MISKKIIFYSDDISFKEIFYIDKNEKIQGEFIRYYFNGNIAEKVNYVDGIMEGSFYKYNRQGFLEIEGCFSNDKKEGKWLYFDKNNNLIKKNFYISGKKCDEYDYKKYIFLKRVN